MALRVEFHDPSPEGTALLRALRQGELDVRPVAAEEAGRSGPCVLVVATDAPGGEEAARASAARRGVTVVLLGPPLDGLSTLHLPRPVSPDALLDTVRRLVHGGEATIATSEHLLTGAALVERTVRLGEAPPPWTGEAPAEPSPSEARPATAAEGGPLRRPFDEQLSALYRRADRALFPDRSPLELWLPADEPEPQQLVPDEVLLAADPGDLEEQPLPGDGDGLTFVLSLPEAERSPSSSAPPGMEPTWISGERPAPPPPSSPPASAPDAGADAPLGSASRVAPVGDPTSSPPATAPSVPPRSERLEGSAAVARLWRMAEGGGRCVVEVDFVDPANRPIQVRLSLDGPEPLEVQGPVATPVAEEAWRRGWLDAPPAGGEDEASSALRCAREAGVLPAGWLEAALRQRREDLLRALGAAERAVVRIRRRSSAVRAPVPPVRGALAEHLVAGARRWRGREDLAARLGEPLDQTTLQPTERFATWVRLARLEPELAQTILEHAGRPVSVLLAAHGERSGLAGLLWALLTADALRPARADAPARVPAATPAVACLEAWLWRARRLPHHELLGVPLTAGPEQVRQAHARAVEEVRSVRAGEDANNEAWLREVLDALDEALAVLGEPELAERYRRALQGAPRRMP